MARGDSLRTSLLVALQGGGEERGTKGREGKGPAELIWCRILDDSFMFCRLKLKSSDSGKQSRV